jgi:hypothetical protein
VARPLRPDTLGGRHHGVSRIAVDETQKPNLRGFKVYIGDFVAPEDPGNDPQDLAAVPPIDTSPSSPPFLNGFGYVDPLWFAHGLDGETDMGGSYDLLTGTPVSGDVAWVCPLEWRSGMPDLALFPAIIEEGATDADDIIIVCCQRHDAATGNVRVYWPVYATAYP